MADILMQNSPIRLVRDHFGTFSVTILILKTFLWIFIAFFLDSPSKMLLIGNRLDFLLHANLGVSQIWKSPSILSFSKIASEEMFLS